MFSSETIVLVSRYDESLSVFSSISSIEHAGSVVNRIHIKYEKMRTDEHIGTMNSAGEIVKMNFEHVCWIFLPAMLRHLEIDAQAIHLFKKKTARKRAIH